MAVMFIRFYELWIFQTHQTAIAEFATLAGWRFYVTNAPSQRLSFEEAVSYYREQWRPEWDFHRFKRGRLPALLIYFQDENRIQGLMFILTIRHKIKKIWKLSFNL